MSPELHPCRGLAKLETYIHFFNFASLDQPRLHKLLSPVREMRCLTYAFQQELRICSNRTIKTRSLKKKNLQVLKQTISGHRVNYSCSGINDARFSSDSWKIFYSVGFFLIFFFFFFFFLHCSSRAGGRGEKKNTGNVKDPEI